jgi:hypothetical protein
MIGLPHATIVDRSIIIHMVRATRAEAAALRPLPSASRKRIRPELQLLTDWKRRALRWLTDHEDALAAIAVDDIEPTDRFGLYGRAWDRWAPLLLLGRQAGGEPWFASLGAAAVLAASNAGVEVSLDTPLLSDLRDFFLIKGSPNVLFSEEIVAGLNGLEHRVWRELRRGQGINQRWLADKLARFRTVEGLVIAPEKLRDGSRQARGYRKAFLLEVFGRYLDNA